MFLTHWSVHELKQHQPVSRAALRSQHSVPCSLCQPKPHQKPQGNIRRRNIRRWILPMKDTENGFSEAWWCVQSAATRCQCVWGGQSPADGAWWEQWRRLSCAGKAPQGVTNQGWWEQSAGISAGISPGPTSKFWSCQLPFSQVLSTLQELSPSTWQKIEGGTILSPCPCMHFMVELDYLQPADLAL